MGSVVSPVGASKFALSSRVHDPVKHSILNDPVVAEKYDLTEREDIQPTYFNYTELDPSYARCIDASKLRGGRTEFCDFNDFKPEEDFGVTIDKHTKVSPTTLKFQRGARVLATAGAVLINAVSLVGLLFTGGKLFANTIRGDDVEDSYSSLGHAYSASAVAGALTGASQESTSWTLGAAGMGLSSSLLGLNSIGGLGVFSIADGLQAIGMGVARKRDEQNLSIYENSIFSKGGKYLRFLMPSENGIKSFFKNITDMKGVMEVEPYALFERAGGGLIAGGGLLTGASLFSNYMSEGVKNLLYAPYALLSALNLVAFYRDGAAVLKREERFKGRKTGEGSLMKAEGNLKKLAAPILGVNNVILALKSLGLDSSGTFYNIAMSIRAWGAATAFGAFGAQSLKKFINDEEFGPKSEEIFDITIHRDKGAQAVLDVIDKVEQMKKDDPEYSLVPDDKYHKLLSNPNNGISDVIDSVLKTPEMERTKYYTQAGTITPPNESRAKRWMNNRFVHQKRVAAVAMLVIDTMIENIKDDHKDNQLDDLRNYLISRRDLFVLTALLHDVGHGPLSHDLEKITEGHDNDEGSVDILSDDRSGVVKVIKEHYGEKEGAIMLEEMNKILGNSHPLSKAYKYCDYVEYVRTGDYMEYNLGFPKWGFEDIIEYAKNLEFVVDEEGSKKTTFNQKGAEMAFRLRSDRKFGCDYVNNRPDHEMSLMAYMLAVKSLKYRPSKLASMTETEIHNDVRAMLAREEDKNLNYFFETRYQMGGRGAYQGYDDEKPESQIPVSLGDGGSRAKITSWAKLLFSPQFKEQDPTNFAELKPRYENLHDDHHRMTYRINVVNN